MLDFAHFFHGPPTCSNAAGPLRWSKIDHTQDWAFWFYQGQECQGLDPFYTMVMLVCYWGHKGARSPSSSNIYWPYNVPSTRNRSIVFVSWRLFGLIQSLDGWLDLCLDCDFSFVSIMVVGLSCFFKLWFSAYMPWDISLLCVYDLAFTNGFFELSCEILPPFTANMMVISRFYSRKVTIIY